VKILVKKGILPDPTRYRCFVVPVYEGDSEPSATARRTDHSSGKWISELLRSREFEGKHLQTEMLHIGDSGSGWRVVLAGMGKRTDFNLDRVRGAYAKAAQTIRSANIPSFSTAPDFGPAETSVEDLTEAMVEGAILGSYQFTPYKTIGKEEIRRLSGMSILLPDDRPLAPVRAAVARAESVCNAVCFSRDMVSAPGNEMTPTDMVGRASVVAKRKNVTLKVLDERKMKALGMNALLGVARGSAQPPRFIILEYHGGKKADKPLVLVGKGLTFDSGGISIKPAAEMDEMKYDMCGAASVLGVFKALAELQPEINVVGLIPACENLPGSRAVKPGDVVTSLSGQTIEILNTDAEGRLVLCDALTYAERFKPQAVLDIATLTGACVIALGGVRSGFFSGDAALSAAVAQASESSQDLCWPMPLDDDYAEGLKTSFADVANVPGRPGGAITTAKFLQRFTSKYPWGHLDIAGSAWKSGAAKGATGRPVGLLLHYVLSLQTPAA